VNKNELVVLPL